MADQDASALFRHLATQIAGLSTIVGAQGIAQIVHKFDGDPKHYKTWIKSIEKYALLTNLHDDRVKLVAYQSSGGSVSDFIQRYLSEHTDKSWADLKAELTSRFAEISDPQHAFMLLRKAKQKSDENVQLFAERLLALAEEAFAGQNGGATAIERQLVGFFIDGLAHDYLKMKVMRENPATLQAAVTSAMNEQNLRKRFNLRVGKVDMPRREEPMQIDHLRPSRRCFKCNQSGHLAKDCPKVSRQGINAVEHYSGRGLPRGRNQGRSNAENMFQRHKPQNKSEIVCWHCGRKGHFLRECRDRSNQSSNMQRSEN